MEEVTLKPSSGEPAVVKSGDDRWRGHVHGQFRADAFHRVTYFAQCDLDILVDQEFDDETDRAIDDYGADVANLREWGDGVLDLACHFRFQLCRCHPFRTALTMMIGRSTVG